MAGGPMNLGHRQSALRKQQFAGREVELAAVRAAIDGESDAQVFLVHGPGGTGKTALLLELATRHPRALYVDARDLESDPSVLESALAPGLREPSSLVMVDTVE